MGYLILFNPQNVSFDIKFQIPTKHSENTGFLPALSFYVRHSLVVFQSLESYFVPIMAYLPYSYKIKTMIYGALTMCHEISTRYLKVF